jgi:hypothetical protein
MCQVYTRGTQIRHAAHASVRYQREYKQVRYEREYETPRQAIKAPRAVGATSDSSAAKTETLRTLSGQLPR